MQHFKVEIDVNGTSPNPQVSIWQGGHICVSEDYEDGLIDDASLCGRGIIKHQLAGDRGHYSCLKFAFIKFNCFGFPHSVIAQITRHQDSGFLVQSSRVTGQRFVDVALGRRDVEDVFYLRPPGKYRDRSGHSFEYTEQLREEDLDLIENACYRYAERVAEGCPYEMARGIIPYDCRQNFTMAGTLEAIWHAIDHRSKGDSQLEIQKLAELMMLELDKFTPELSAWYRENRYGKARLAP